jgi:glycosyltransferase involved in cell wall biosynthesis
MKILAITASLDERSGWGRYSRSVVIELARQGYDIEAVSEDTTQLPNIRVFHVDRLRSRVDLLTLVRNAIRIRELSKHADIVHAFDGWPYGVYGYAAVVGTQKRLLMNGVGTYSVAPLFEKGSAFLLRRAYSRAKAVLCISDYTRDQIVSAGIPSAKVRTVLMGAPILPQVSRQQMQQMSEKIGIAGLWPIVLTVGSIKDRKGQFETLKAVEILKKKYPDIVYVVAGSGNQKEYIATMQSYAQSHDLERNLRILTSADDTEISALYASCTVFALNSNTDLPSHHFEGFGLVILEAAQYGKPSVGSRDSGIESAVDDGKTGLLTNQHDPVDIAEKIGSLLDRYDFFSGNAKMWHSKFTWGKTVDKYIEAYKE